MILVDIFVPSVDKTYDFQLNESVAIGALIEEVVEMVGQRERCRISGDFSDFQLCAYDKQCALPEDKTLEECGICTGHSLILV